MEFTTLPADVIGVIAGCVFTPRFTLSRSKKYNDDPRISLNTEDLNDLVHLQMTCKQIHALAQHRTKDIAHTLKRYHSTIDVYYLVVLRDVPEFNKPVPFKCCYEPIIYFNMMRKQLVRRFDEKEKPKHKGEHEYVSCGNFTIEQLDQLCDRHRQQLCDKHRQPEPIIRVRPSEEDYEIAYNLFLEWSRQGY